MRRTITDGLTKDTRLCISLAGRPGNTGTRFHNYLYDALGLDYVYKAFTTTDIVAAIGGVRALGIRGCAVSMPWKSAVILLVDEMDPSAAAIESVNTIVNTDGRLRAYNTDYLAIVSLLRDHGVTPRSTAVLGSGGMAKATVAALRDSGFTDVTVVARNEATGTQLAERYGFSWQAEFADLRPSLLVNCTPLGMEGADVGVLAAPEKVVAAAEVVFDVVPRPARTVLVRRAEELGTPTITGAEVMSLQALEQFVLYTGVRPEPDLVAKATAFSRYEEVPGDASAGAR
ncbi:shikimate 5-dehydrogenase [Propionicicella superfundia]|uniref:shikimate 5-dehydrogenase n=1 Tax=Propionicicella superfundia TaxID=348582 RepID=UPI00040F319A|nr:shikimate 5-dehydrogenase [Propionicicella superfundia]